MPICHLKNGHKGNDIRQDKNWRKTISKSETCLENSRINQKNSHWPNNLIHNLLIVQVKYQVQMVLINSFKPNSQEEWQKPSEKEDMETRKGQADMFHGGKCIQFF